ncbi:MAG: adenylyltransferase/cytidyltransferase family protein [Patescibacteria group bacterium]
MRCATSYKILTLEQIAVHAKALKQKSNGKIVFTNGAFDLLHEGHVRYLERAAGYGDYLFVGINSDARIKSQKGSERPILSENVRARIIAAFEAVDRVVIYDDLESAVRNIMPHVIIASQTTAFDPEANRYAFAKAAGIEVQLLNAQSKLHTTDIIKKMRSVG